jgi:cytochrome P450
MAVVRPPGPRDWACGLRLIGRIKRDILGFYTELHRQYGDAVYMRLGPYQDYNFFHPEPIKEVLSTQARHFIRMRRPLRVLGQWNGQGLLITEGETWLRHRRLVQPAFAPRRFSAYAEAMVAAARERLDGWSAQAAAAPLAIEFDQAMTDLTMEIIARTMFGAALGSDARELGEAVHVLSEVAIREMMAPFTLPDWLPLPGKAQKRWAMATIDALVRRFIRDRRASHADRGDLLSMLLLAVDEEGDGRGLTDEQARDQCVTIFLAGHDTTAAGMTWIGWALASHPEIAARAAAEVSAALGGRDPTFADLPRLAYVECVVKEALRHYPPAIGVFARQATSDVQIGQWVLPRGSIARVVSYVVHHDERWFPDPDAFDPDRFAAGREEQIPACAYLPFGAGPRMCIGYSFAMTEMTLLTAMLLQRFTLAPAAGQEAPELDVKMSLRPKGGLRLALSPA